MVGELRDKIWKFGPHGGRSEVSPNSRLLPAAEPMAAGAQRRITISLTGEQFGAILQQWSPSERNSPTEVVITVNSQPVGILEVVASRLVDVTDPGPTKAVSSSNA